MTFHDLLNSNSICIDTTSKSKASVLLNISKLMNQCYSELNIQELFDAYWERESLGSTTIGHGILIPHVCLKSIKSTYGCFIKLQNPVDFDAEDKQPVDLVFGLASATDAPDTHLQTLSKIVTTLRNQEFVSECRLAKTNKELSDVLTKETVIQL
jgi:nitrogen PTS system EIIA component